LRIPASSPFQPSPLYPLPLSSAQPSTNVLLQYGEVVLEVEAK
jgi:hypothetical protein